LYVKITCHYINNDYQLCSRVLQTRDLPESHIGEHVAHVIQKVSLEWGCGISFLTTDNASNMKVAAKVANISVHLGCFAHTLNLASCNCKALDIIEVHQALAKIRSIVGFLHRRTTAAALFKKKQAML
jgi:hypothetical protein